MRQHLVPIEKDRNGMAVSMFAVLTNKVHQCAKSRDLDALLNDSEVGDQDIPRISPHVRVPMG